METFGENFMKSKRYTLKSLVAATVVSAMGAALAADPVKLATIVELSGPGTTAGTQFKDGVVLAIEEINAAGGILGRKIDNSIDDTQTNPGVAKGLTQKAVDNGVFAIFGPVYSGSIMVSQAESRRAGVPNFTGGEGAAVTQQGNPYVFRTSFGQSVSFPKVARYVNTVSKNVAIIYVNNDFGKGGRDTMVKLLAGTGTKVAADISTDQGQVDFTAAVLQAKNSNADAVFAYLNEEESARLLVTLRKQGWNKPIIGETTLTGQKVIELAGAAANGAKAHVGLTAEAPIFKEMAAKFKKRWNANTDHNGIKGYTGVYLLKAAIDRVGKFDREAVAKAMHNTCYKAAKNPGILMDVCWDGKGDLDRDSFMIEVVDGKGKVTGTLPPLNAK
jgi:branched-chain amino acid transport system substrate-binding protein